MLKSIGWLPDREQVEANDLPGAVVYASTPETALKAQEALSKRCGLWYPTAVPTLADERGEEIHVLRLP